MAEKLTDKEIINAWNEEIHLANYVNEAYRNCVAVSLIEETVKFLEHQQAEIERLQSRLKKERHQFEDVAKMYDVIKAEAIKEFAERLKNSLKGYGGLYCLTTMKVRIDNLVKEMVGEQG